MAPRKKPKRVATHWHLFEEMQRIIDAGATPNDAAVTIATKHWKKTPSKSFDACIWWLKDNQRKFAEDLNPLAVLDAMARAYRAEIVKRMTPQQRELYEEEMAGLRRMMEDEAELRRHPRLARKLLASPKRVSTKKRLKA
jgi:hypothetical protein